MGGNHYERRTLDQRILRKLFEETLSGRAIDEEVKGVAGRNEGSGEEQRGTPHIGD